MARDGARARRRARARAVRALLVTALARATMGVAAREASASGARGAEACVNLGARDAVVAVCVQNDFMDERAGDGSYAGGPATRGEVAGAGERDARG